MNCNCQHEASRADQAAHIAEHTVVPCSPEMLARLQAEYFPSAPPPGITRTVRD